MVCLRCLLQRFADNARRAMEKWADVPAIANTHRRRLFELENELSGVDPCDHDHEEVS